MKHLAALFIFCFAIQQLHAQQTISVTEEKGKMSLGYNTCVKVFIPDALQKDVERDWAKKLAKDYNAKGDSKKGEYFFDNVALKEFGTNTVDIYSSTEDVGNGTILRVYYDLGGTYMNSQMHPDKYDVAQKYIHEFAANESAAAVGEQIAAAQKVLDLKTKEQSDLEKQKEDLKKKIEDCKSAIAQAESDIETNEKNQDAKKNEINDQQKAVDALKTKQVGIK